MAENSSELDRALLRLCCPLMILTAFFIGKPSLLSIPKWRSIAYSGYAKERYSPHSPIAMSELSFFMEKLAELPALYQQCNECLIHAKGETVVPHLPKLLNLITRVSRMHDGIRAWKQKWDDEHQDDQHETLPSATTATAQITPWTTIKFLDLNAALILAMYNSVLILLTSISKSLLEADQSNSFCLTSTEGENDIIEMQELPLLDVKASVQDICRSADFYLQSLQPSHAPADYYLFFPVHIARRASLQSGYSFEYFWLDKVTEMMKSKFSMGIWANMDLGDRFSGLHDGLFD